MHSEENLCFQALTNQKSAYCPVWERGLPTGIINRRIALEWHLAVHMGGSERWWAPKRERLLRFMSDKILNT
jgi:hypothetical protein